MTARACVASIKDSHATSGMVLDRAGQIIVWQGTDYKDERCSSAR